MHPPTPKPTEAVITARRAGLLVPSRPGSISRARARTWGHGTGVGYSSAPAAARRRLLVASLGVRESLPAQSLGEDAVAMEVNLAQSHSPVDLEQVDDDDAEILPSPDGTYELRSHSCEYAAKITTLAVM